MSAVKIALLFFFMFVVTAFVPKAHAQTGPWPCGGSQTINTFGQNTPYVTGNVVIYYGITYQAVQPSTGQQPCSGFTVNSAYWTQQVGASGVQPPANQQFVPVLDASNCGNTSKPSWCAGTDIGAWVTAANTFLAGNQGLILVDASVASYSQLTPMKISLTTQLACQGTPINWGQTTGEALVISGPTQGATVTSVTGCNFISTAGAASSTTNIGVYLGGDPSNTITPSTSYGNMVSIINTQFKNFNKGLTNGNNVWLIGLHHIRLNGNNTQIYTNVNGTTNTGEENVIDGGSVIYDGGTGMFFNGNGSQWRISDTSFDFDTVVELSGNVNVDLKSVHFEGNIGCPIAPTGLALINSIGGDWAFDASGTASGFICPTSPNVQSSYNVSDWALETPGSGTVTNLIHTGLSSSILFCPYTQNIVFGGSALPDSWIVDSGHFSCGSTSH